MKPEQQRIAIAEACPDVACKNIYGQYVWRENQSRFFDPLNDLNAMHEAEKMLAEKGVNTWWTYAEHLLRGGETPFGAETAIHATAAQRAEAFLHTLNLWKP